MVSRFRQLTTEDAGVVILKPMAFPTLCSPESPMKCKPHEKLDLRQHGSLPEFRGTQECRPSLEEGAIGQGRHVVPGFRPLPNEPVSDRRLQDDAFQRFPEDKVFVDDPHGRYARDVAHPSTLEHDVLHRAPPATPADGVGWAQTPTEVWMAARSRSRIRLMRHPQRPW